MKKLLFILENSFVTFDEIGTFLSILSDGDTWILRNKIHIIDLKLLLLVLYHIAFFFCAPSIINLYITYIKIIMYNLSL